MLCLSATLTVAVNAAPDPMAAMFQDQLLLLDVYYDFNYEYMIRIATDEFISWGNWDPVSVSAEEFDAALHKYFNVDEQTIEDIREYGNRGYSGEYYDSETGEVTGTYRFFDEETQTYTFENLGGFGGNLPPREYLGYVQNGETYDIYYRNLTYEFLDDLLDEEELDALLGEEWTDTVEYNGNVYEAGPDGYYRILSRDNFGRKYTVEVRSDIVRVLSCVNYTEEHLPDAFDDKEVEEEVSYDIPENGNIAIPENDCFEGNTVVKAEEIRSGNTMQTVNKAMETVAQKFVAYEFTATKDNVAVQPNGKLTVTFAIPDGYSNNVTVFYMDKDGGLSQLNTTVDATARTATAELEHFSTYILADKDSKPHQHSYEKVITPPTCTEKGFTTYTCSCGDTYTANEVAENGHSYSKIVTPPTCTEEGYTTYTCSCGDTYTANKVTAMGHSFGDWEEITAPTYAKQGEEKRQCTKCTHFETRPIAVLTPPPETTVPVTTVPETAVPETTVPGTTVPETTVPETTVPETTVPETTVPETTVPETSENEVTESIPIDPDTAPVESNEEEAQTDITPNETLPTDSDGDGALGIIIAVILVAALAVGAVVLIKIKKNKTMSN